MSTISAQSTIHSVASRDKSDVFQDLPLIDRTARLNVMELRNSDSQIINELVYRWCRVLTRESKTSLDRLSGPSDSAIKDLRKVLIIDTIGTLNSIRLATILKRDEKRMRYIGIARGCKINSTYVTLSSYIGKQMSITSSIKLIVIYHDEFYILKTLTLLKDCLQNLKCQVLLVVPRLDRREQDVLNLTSNFQTIKCEFCVNRRDIGPAPPATISDSYQKHLNQIQFSRIHGNKALPGTVYGELREDGLHLYGLDIQKKQKDERIPSFFSKPVIS